MTQTACAKPADGRPHRRGGGSTGTLSDVITDFFLTFISGLDRESRSTKRYLGLPKPLACPSPWLARALGCPSPWPTQTLGLPKPLACPSPWPAQALGLPKPLACQCEWIKDRRIERFRFPGVSVSAEESDMVRQSKSQKQTTARVMHEFKHGELRTGAAGPKVKDRRLPSLCVRRVRAIGKPRRRTGRAS